jgi:predicted DsbA family dithiol-disulfide isomerase
VVVQRVKETVASASAEPDGRLMIEVVSDIVCPWCFIGRRRLADAIDLVRRSRPDFVCTTLWRPFFLNPDTPPSGEPYLLFLEQKFGGRAAVEALFARVREAGRKSGIEFAFEKIAVRANTLKAHRLLHWAQARGDADALVERLFVAQFQRGENVGDPATLARIAGECGFGADEAAAYLASTQDEELVCGMERGFRERGIAMVPTFVVAGRRIIVGAEDPALLADALRDALA